MAPGPLPSRPQVGEGVQQTVARHQGGGSASDVCPPTEGGADWAVAFDRGAEGVDCWPEYSQH